MLDQLYRQVIMDHAKHRHNYGHLAGEDITQIRYKNPTCGDVISLYIKVKDCILADGSFAKG